MSALDRHIEASDTGVLASDLFIYDEKYPGTGGLVTNVQPKALLPGQETTLIQTDWLQITFRMDRAKNRGEMSLQKRDEPTSADRKAFQLTQEFQTKAQVSLTVLFSEWKILAIIDGEPLVLHHEG